ncbi:MAG: hypothetical protein SVO26_05025 [Chloroflexota bacterium]|nr:hypothetical protein [Chloroflexota bacterium]
MNSGNVKGATLLSVKQLPLTFKYYKEWLLNNLIVVYVSRIEHKGWGHND